jgi:DNA-directed RNA polymerase alpha subunit
MKKELTFSLEYWRDRANFFEDYIESIKAQRGELREFIVERVEKENQELKEILVRLTDAIAVQLKQPIDVTAPIPGPSGDYAASYLKTISARRIRVDSLEMTVRCANVLRNENIETLRDVCKYTEAELLRIPNFGRKSLNELKGILHDHGLSLNYRSE